MVEMKPKPAPAAPPQRAASPAAGARARRGRGPPHRARPVGYATSAGVRPRQARSRALRGLGDQRHCQRFL